ncbi:MAG: hypothetical protein LBD53_04730 [Tannerella sp.]|jgi:tRNA A37 methylthiotransferase MiaB|nr:hypothetical protein [Tannerella sp.]
MAYSKKDIDIDSYRFTSDSEPTDAQLETLMREVSEDVRKHRIEIKKRLQQQIQEEYNHNLANYSF